MFMPSYQRPNSFERDVNRNDAATMSNTVANQGWKTNQNFDGNGQTNVVGKTTNYEMSSNVDTMRQMDLRQVANSQQNQEQDFSRQRVNQDHQRFDRDYQRISQDRQRFDQDRQRVDQDSVSSVRIPVQPAPHRAPSVNHWKPTSDLSV